MERQLRRLPPEVAELVIKVRAGELPATMLGDLVAELEDLGRSDAALSAALDRLATIEVARQAAGAAEKEASR